MIYRFEVELNLVIIVIAILLFMAQPPARNFMGDSVCLLVQMCSKLDLLGFATNVKYILIRAKFTNGQNGPRPGAP